jgi:transcription antitermination protein NusB
MSQKTSPKTRAREYAFKFLYSIFLDKTGKKKEEVLDLGLGGALSDFDTTYFEPDTEHPLNTLDDQGHRFAEKLIQGTLLHEEELCEELNTVMHNWKAHQLDKVDYTVLLMALFELNHIKETPTKVVMNESINISKSYGSNDSSGFINGILDKIKAKHES